MALLGFEGWDYETSATINTDLGTSPSYWAGSAGGNKSSTTPYGVGSSFTPTAAGQFAQFFIGSSKGTLIAGFKFRPANFAATMDILRFYDGSSVQCGLGVNTSGKLIFYRGTTATILATSTTVLSASTWYLLELKVTFSTSGNSDGSFELRIDTVSEMSASGTVDNTTTTNASANSVLVGFMAAGAAAPFYDDFWVCDNSGGVANDFIGNVRVESLFVSSDNSVTWTPLSSTNASNVDEANSDGDTTYNSKATSGVDLFNHGSLSSTPSIIYGVCVAGKIRKDDTTAKTARNKLKSGTTTQNGATRTPITTYQWYHDFYTTDPDTSVAWTSSAVNASKIGYEHI